MLFELAVLSSGSVTSQASSRKFKLDGGRYTFVAIVGGNMQESSTGGLGAYRLLYIFKTHNTFFIA